MKRIYRLLLSGLIIFASCKSEEKPVTKEEAQTFAATLEKTIAKRDESFFDKAFSLDGLTRSIEKSEKNELSKKDMRDFKQGMGDKLKIGTQLIGLMGEKATYQLVRIYEKDKEQHVIFRLYDEGKLNYHDMRMIHEKGQVKVADMFVYATGENFSETLLSLFEGMMTSDKKRSLQNAESMGRIKTLVRTNKGREALDEIEAMPEELQKVKAVRIMKMQAAMSINDDDSIYLKVIDEFSNAFPDNGKMSLMLLDGFIMHKEYDKALECVNKLDAQINKDPMLDFYRAMCYNLKEDKTAARASLEKLHASMPTFVDGAMELVMNYCDTKDFEKAATVLNKIKGVRGFDARSLEQVKMLYPEIADHL